MAQDNNNLIWIDMEMSGLLPDSDVILELAVVMTDANLEILAESPVLVVHQSELAHKLDVLDRWKNILLVITIGYGLVLAGLHMYNVWQYGSTSHVG